jgi:hypothetical protein
MAVTATENDGVASAGSVCLCVRDGAPAGCRRTGARRFVVRRRRSTPNASYTASLSAPSPSLSDDEVDELVSLLLLLPSLEEDEEDDDEDVELLPPELLLLSLPLLSSLLLELLLSELDDSLPPLSRRERAGDTSAKDATDVLRVPAPVDAAAGGSATAPPPSAPSPSSLPSSANAGATRSVRN